MAEDREVRSLVLASMEEGVLLLDRDGERVFANEALERHLGSIPVNAEHLLPLDLKDAVRRASLDGVAVEAEAETGAPSRWLRATARPVGEDGSVLLVVSDVTEARRIDAIRRDFVTNASHELKTPVASIRAAAETLRDGAIDDPVAAIRFTEQLEREALRLARIVSDPLGPVAARDGQRARRDGAPRPRGGRGGPTARGRRRRGRRRPHVPKRRQPRRPRGCPRPRPDDPQPRRQRRPVHACGRFGRRSSNGGAGPGGPDGQRHGGRDTRVASSPGCSNGSTASTVPAPGRRAGPGSAYRSCGTWRRTTEASSRSAASSAPVRRSRSGCLRSATEASPSLDSRTISQGRSPQCRSSYRSVDAPRSMRPSPTPIASRWSTHWPSPIDRPPTSVPRSRSIPTCSRTISPS